MIERKLTILLLASIFATTSHANLEESAKLQPCMEQHCIAYFEKWQAMAKKKHSRALSGLAELYYQGYGTKKDLDLSLKKFRKASKFGFTYAHYRTALFYLNEKGYIDYEQGVNYLRKASRAKHGESSFLLAVIYSSKDLGFFDVDDADKYLARAITANNNNAQKYVELLDSQGLLSEKNHPETLSYIEQLNKGSKTAVEYNRPESQLLAETNKIEWPKDENIEVISVSAPSLEDVFDHELAKLDVAVPDVGHRQSIGKLRDCIDIPTCGSAQINGDKFNEFIYRSTYKNLFKSGK